MGSSQTRARTHVRCIGRWILNHCATREVLSLILEVTPEPVYKSESHYFTMTYRHGPKITLPSKYYLLASDLLFVISEDIRKKK